MTNLRPTRLIPALGLGLTLIMAGTATIQAQQPAAPASGSRVGTGTGREAGAAGAAGTGTESGFGLGTTSGIALPAGRPITPLLPRQSIGPRPDPLSRPRVVDPAEVQNLFGKEEVPLVREASRITDPGERSLAMVRIARTSIFLGRPDLGHIAIIQAATDSLLEANDALRDQRLVYVIQAALQLAEEHMREIALIQGNAEPNKDEPNSIRNLPPAVNVDRKSNLERGRQEWDLAFRLAFAIKNRSSRTETLYRVVESESLGSSALVREPSRLSNRRPDPGRLTPDMRDFSDALLGTAIEHAQQIERPVWRDRGLVAIASNAATSGQFVRALEAARAIPQPEVRTDSLLKIAENQVLYGRPDYATETYAEAARTIAMVPKDDPRETLVGVFIDSLIAFGRFDDAREASKLYSNPANPPIALAAVAESQGRRNLADSARKWIAAESDPNLRSLLMRKLNDGVLAAIEQRRSTELTQPER
jgi:hypothetical protein